MVFPRAFAVSLGLLALAFSAPAADVTGPLTFVGVDPCRIVETRSGLGFSGQAGPPALVANATRTFQITGTVPGVPTQCGIPSTAVAISVNFTVVNFGGPGDLRVFPAGGTLPLASILNYRLENTANATTVPLGPVAGGQRGITVQADISGTDFIADVNGYYVPRPLILESGQTLTGPFVVSTRATTAGDFMWGHVSFPVRLAAAPTPFFINGGAPTADCPGSAANPTAAPGRLCVYTSACGSVTGSPDCAIFSGVSGGCNTASPVGFSMFLASNIMGNVFCYGMWAVTAP